MRDWTPQLRERLARLKLAPAREAEIIEELSIHLDDRYEELVAGGAAPAEARTLALAELRDEDLLARRMSPLRQAHVHEPPPPGTPNRRLIGDLVQDIRYALRMLARERGFAAAVILTLALGIGANTAVFSLVNATLLQRLPARQPEQLVYVFSGPTASSVFSYPGYVELRDGTDRFVGLAAWGGITASLSADGDTDLATGAIVTGNFFDTLGVQATRGRVLTTQDDVTPGAHPVVVITDNFWRHRFGGREDIVNHDITLNGRTFTIVGVMPPGFNGAQVGIVRDFYVPMMMQALMRPPRAGYSGEMNPDLLNVRGNSWLFTIGRLQPGQTAATAATALSTLQTNLDRASNPSAPARHIMVVPVNDDMPGQRAQMLPVARLLLAVVGAVLLIGCANIANLLLSRATARRREIAIRLAIGASRWRLVRQLLTESVLLALAGGAAGLGLAWLVVSGFRATPPPAGALPVTVSFTIDTPVLLFTLALSIATGLFFGLAPALRASRPGLVPALKDDAVQADERTRRFNLKKALVVVEVALSLMLLVGAGLFIKSLVALRSISPGLDVESLVSAPLNINLLRYTRDQGQAFYRDVVSRIESMPGVESATVARITPLTNGGRVVGFQVQNRAATGERFQSDNSGMVANGRQTAFANVIGPRFFRTLGIMLLKGRDFTNEDAATAPPVAIISDAFARAQFAGTDAVGQRISTRGPQGPWIEIVGVVADSKYASLNEEPAPVVYLPLSQNHETGMVLFVRATSGPDALSSSVRQAIQKLEPNLPVPPVQPMTETVATSIYPARMGAGLLTVFGALALLLASVGLYGVLAFLVSRRTREMGIRVALGASRRDVFALVLREGLTLIVIGAAIGVVGAAFGVKSISALLYGVEVRDAAIFLIAPVVLVIVGVLACLLPARRAMRVDPTVALKSS